ncbi:MAG: hypothetical protein FJZ92_11310 [Chloroflexi bacterium]|nr:hypothetical protein [Chloroflexota bacterium]
MGVSTKGASVSARAHFSVTGEVGAYTGDMLTIRTGTDTIVVLSVAGAEIRGDANTSAQADLSAGPSSP